MPDSASLPTQTPAQTTTQTLAPKIAIIGGGLTGLFTATLLERAFIKKFDQAVTPHITIFEKPRSVGRLATRYRSKNQTNTKSSNQWQWSFGAQFFTAKTADFQQFIKPWLETDLLQPWCAQVINLSPIDSTIKSNNQSIKIEKKEQWNTSQARYISSPKMTSWGRALAEELQHTDIKFKTRVAPLKKESFIEKNDADIKSELFDEQGSSLGYFDWVICTVPNGQAVELMTAGHFSEQAKISEPKMQACYTLMLGWDDEQPLPANLNNQALKWDVAYLQNSILDRIFIEHQKPAHDQLLPSVTIHARNDWSEQHVDDDIESIKLQLLEAAQQALNWDSDSAPTQSDCHRWRYAATLIDDKDKNSASNPTLGILVDKHHQWIVSGDWCGRGNIESCYQMAAETALIICS